MKAIVGGDYLGNIKLYKGADKATINVMVIKDNGDLIDLTGDSIDVDIYQNNARSASPALTISGSLVTAASGLAAITPTDTETDTLSPGTYQYFVKHTTSADLITLSGPGMVSVL